MAPVSCVSEPVEGPPHDLADDEQMCTEYTEEGYICTASDHCETNIDVCMPVKQLDDPCEDFAECREGSVCNLKVCMSYSCSLKGKQQTQDSLSICTHRRREMRS